MSVVRIRESPCVITTWKLGLRAPFLARENAGEPFKHTRLFVRLMQGVRLIWGPLNTGYTVLSLVFGGAHLTFLRFLLNRKGLFT